MDSKSRVKAFYEQVGWKQERRGIFVDAARNEDLRPVSEEYRHKCHMRVNGFIPASGKFLLDIASGPIQYPEYLTYSRGYEYHLCADITYNALIEARRVLVEKGLFVQCDITRLPFKSASMDGIVSLHTIYHVPADEQVSAFEELMRALKPGASAAIVYSWSNHSPLMAIAMLPYRFATFIWVAIKRFRKTNRPRGREEPKIYFHPHPHRWFEKNLKPRMAYDIFVWRSLNVPFLKVYIHHRLFGKRFLVLVYTLEEKFPRFFGRMGAYPLFVIRKMAA